MNSKTYLLFLSLFFICFHAAFVSGQSNKHLIDSIAKEFLKHSPSSCIAIGIIDHGEQKIYCYGNTDKNNGIAVDSNTLFEIGSDTKLFTATATAIEVSEGRLRYDDSLSLLIHTRHIPSYNGHEIKVIDLLHHTSGLPRIPSDLLTINDFDSLNPYKTYSRTILDAYISSCRLELMPGTVYSYSNLGYGLMGDILSRIERKSYEDIIREKVWEPLKMDYSTIALSEDQKRTMALPYNGNGEQDHIWDFDALAGAGSIRSNVSDMLKFLSASMYPENLKDNKLKNALIDCQTRMTDAGNGIKVGLGWHSQPFNLDRLYFHAGETGGYYSFIGFTKARQKGIVILTNSPTETDQIALRILEMSTHKN